jgi:hypothetical protein
VEGPFHRGKLCLSQDFCIGSEGDGQAGGMDVKPSLDPADRQAGIECGDLAESRRGFLLKVVGSRVIGSELAHEHGPGHELRGLFLLNDHKSPIANPCIEIKC